MRRRRWRWTVLALAALLVLWLGGDFVHSRIVQHRVERWERTVVRDADGVREGCRAFSVGNGEAALLLVHGFGTAPAVYRPMAERLAGSGFACRAMRLPGSAVSLEEYATVTREQWRAALEAELDALRTEHERVGIVAHSMGGAVALDLLLDRPDAADGLALLAPLIDVSSERSPLLGPRAWHAIGRRTLLFTRIVENPYPLDARSEEARGYDLFTPFAPVDVTTQIFELVDRIEGRAGELRTPLLLVLAGEDPIVDNGAAEQFYDECASPKRKLVRIEEAGHLLPLDTGREGVADEIAAFFKGPVLD